MLTWRGYFCGAHSMQQVPNSDVRAAMYLHAGVASLGAHGMQGQACGFGAYALTCGGTTLVHMVYNRSKKVVCHCSLDGPTADMALSSAASLVKKRTASLSVNATVHKTH